MYIRKAITAGAMAVLLSVGLTTAAAAKDLTIGYGSEPSSIDPHYHNLTPNNSMAAHIFSRLIEQDEKQNLTPGLAVSCRLCPIGMMQKIRWRWQRLYASPALPWPILPILIIPWAVFTGRVSFQN